MSDCRKFGQAEQADKAPEDRLAELERVWPLMQAKIQTYDQVLNDFQLLKSEVAGMKSLLADLKGDCQQLNQNLSYHFNGCDKKFADISTQMSSLDPKIDAISASVEMQARQTHDQINETKANINNIKQNFQEVFSSVSKKTELEILRDYVEKNHAAFFAALDNAKTLSIDANFNIASINDRIDNIKYNIAETVKKVTANSDQITAMLNAFEAFKQYSSSQLVSESAKSRKEFDEKMTILKNEVTGSPSSLESLKSELVKKMEGIALDGSNAILKANNSAAQISILEKKIENIYLLLKKLELSK